MVRSAAIEPRFWLVLQKRAVWGLMTLLWILAWMWLLAPAWVQAQGTNSRAADQLAAEKETTSTPASSKSADSKTLDSEAVDSEKVASPPGLNLKSLERQFKRTLDKVSSTVVAVSGGSGVVVSEDGYVLTVAHVGMRAGRRVRVTFPDGRQVWGKTLGNDRGVDAGLIKLSGNGPYPHADMGASKDLEAGQWCMALGYPVSFDRGKPPAARIGRVLNSGDTTVVTDCTIMGGDSGGPLFDMEGNVIGVSSRCDNRLTVNIHVPVDCYHDTWQRLVDGEDFNSLSRSIAFLGVAPDDDAEGARIGEVFPGTGASRADIRVGDVLLKFDGKELAKYSDLPPLILKHKPGDEVEIELRRDAKVLRLKARLGDRDG